MLNALCWCVVAGGFIALLGILYDLVNRRGVDPVAFNLFGALFLLPAVLAGINWGALHPGELFEGARAVLLWSSMVLSGGLMCVGVIVLIVAMKRGKPEFAWTFSQCSMVIPFLLGVLCFGNVMHWSNYLGLICVGAGIVLLGRKRKRRSGTDLRKPHRLSHWFLPAAGAFLFIGLSQFLFSIPSYWTEWSDEARIRIPMQALGGLAALFCWKGRVFFQRWDRRTVLFAALFALLTYGGRATLYASLDRLAAFGMAPIGYPICQSIGIVGVALYLGLFRRELTRDAWLFLPPIVVGLFLLSRVNWWW
ncbi:hypothetical protein FYJ85_11775 [Victivallaceae bacterium BBE-744-WT-12]|uniref:EamA-like transporter family protein n=1 Tax=Victivallis lenta TaxID=2606640 RepID=A0A844G238_9BACT|nr:hypothetical protein [Victivallis lenta]MST97717.1 hypothetical protein [Victivallis lenta]